MALPISQSIPRALDRLQEVVTSEAFTDDLQDRASDDFPLPEPETWIQARLNLHRHWKALNVSEVMGVIHPRRGTDVINSYSGDGSKYTRDQKTHIDLGIVVKPSGAFPDVETQGRQMLDDEWLQRRVEKYRGALLDVIPAHAPDPEAIAEVFVDEYQADLFEVDTLGRYAHATVTFDIFQTVNIKSW